MEHRDSTSVNPCPQPWIHCLSRYGQRACFSGRSELCFRSMSKPVCRLPTAQTPVQMVAWWHGVPSMASICEALLDTAGTAQLSRQFETRVRWLERRRDHWLLENEDRTWSLRAKRLVLSGTLLAHPRSLKMLAWDDVPLRTAVEEGVDDDLDKALSLLQHSQAEVRWNLMVDLGVLALNAEELPAQIWFDDAAKARWKVERLVLQPQSDGRWGLVVHGLDSGEAITPESQRHLLAQEQQRLVELLPELLQALPVVQLR